MGEIVLTELLECINSICVNCNYCIARSYIVCSRAYSQTQQNSQPRNQNNTISLQSGLRNDDTACCLLFICHYELTFASNGGHKCLHLGDVIAGKLSDIKRLLIKALLKKAKLERSTSYGCKCWWS